ncbi:hypothetical protein PSEUBRA_002142 [Kalmanozyma brasiliensis GHG001]|uniref:uncharacterized protein n=1 Tax=Kalmanozyma brasiliensis (strain GHG001) TaxID=1365824 RepID=UPI001CE86F4A|nr:uncharacterized protein PSEUBRA_002142 [Kalmanozyma brasiliensis GHG001]EST08385.2 hypothetical protein PSEUBRA_002142 [Kalmanozyma brasiliensis GHG001]
MVHPLIITAAATAGVGAAVAFEVAVFRPWREDNWPHGFGEGVRSEFLKLRREVEQAVHEIQDDLRTLRDGRRRDTSRSRDGHRRLSDDELDDFRRGVGEEASRESAQHEFEMHERQASAYRDRLRASMSESLTSGTDQQDGRLRRRRPAGADAANEDRSARTSIISVPVMDTRKTTSPEMTHHRVGSASSKTDEVPSAQLVTETGDHGAEASTSSDLERGDSRGETEAARNGLFGLDFDVQTSQALDQENARSNASDPFADIVDGTASSWHAVFSDRTAQRADQPATQDSRDTFSPSQEELTEEGHVILDTNGLSQTLSDQQQHSFHDLYADAHSSSNNSHTSGSPYRSNRALHPPSLNPPSTGSRSAGAESEPDFEVISDTADSEGRWSQVQAPPSPTMSSGSKPAAVGGVDMISVHSDGQESWAELSRYGSDEEGSIRSETRVRSLRG